MTDFTKEELKIIDQELEGTIYVDLRDKIQSLIDEHENNKEKEIFSCHTALAVGDEFFCKQPSMTKDDLLPVAHPLFQQCDGKITKPGIYAFKLKLVKIK